MGDCIDGYEQPTALLTKEAANALKEANDELVKKGYRLKIYDAYRPQKAVENFKKWVEDVGDTCMKDAFYPEIENQYCLNRATSAIIPDIAEAVQSTDNSRCQNRKRCRYGRNIRLLW